MQSPIVIATFAAVAIIAIVVGASLLGGLFKERTRLIREQRAREDYASAQNRARQNYESDLNIFGTIFDPIGLVH